MLLQSMGSVVFFLLRELGFRSTAFVSDEQS